MESKLRQRTKSPNFDRHTTRTLAIVNDEAQARNSFKQNSHNRIKISQSNQKYRSIRDRGHDRTSLMVKKGGLDVIKYINLNDDFYKRRETDPKMQKLENFQEKCYLKFNVGMKKNVTFATAEKEKTRQIPIQLYVETKQVFRYLQILKNYGFEQKKIVKWMNIFLCRKSQIICDIFLRSYLNKKSLSDSLIFERFTTLEAILMKMQKQAEKLNQSQILYLISQIRQFKSYIEQIVIKKTQSNLCKIFNIGQVNPMLKYDQGDNVFNNSIQVTHFIKDLKGIEDRYGELSSISKLNRVMFKQVLQAEQKFRNQFYSSKSNA